MSSIFISHSSADGQLAAELKARLENADHNSIFLDFDPEKGTRAGVSWEQTLYRKLDDCNAVIALCTDRYFASNWCFAELALARMLGKPIFPLLLDGLSAPPEKLPFLSEVQCTDLRTEPEQGYQRLWAGLQEKGIETGAKREWSDLSKSPYPGLMAFEEEDAAIFFGREAETGEAIELLNRVRPKKTRLVMVLGASGSGKSSLMRAGMMPRLRSDRSSWLVVGPFIPGTRPLNRLSLALSRAFPSQKASDLRQMLRETGDLAAELEELQFEAIDADPAVENAAVLVVIDQFEELLGHQDQDHEANRVLELLHQGLTARESPLMVLATMRSDFLGDFQQSTFLQGINPENYLLKPMSRDNMRQVI